MSDHLEDILSIDGPLLSTTLAKALVDRHGLSSTAARQRISRGSANVRTLDFLPFPKNARFIYHTSHYGSPRFWSALEVALSESSPAYAAAIQSINARGGLVPTDHFQIACGAPIAQQRHVSAGEILDRLVKTKLFELTEAPGVGQCIGYAKGAAYLDATIAQMKTRLIVEELVLNAVKDWARKLALGSYGKFKLRNDTDGIPQVGTFAWDMSAPSYLGALTKGKTANGAPKPGLFVCDILLGRQVTESVLNPFFRKCTTLRTLRNLAPCLQLFVADSYSAEAFQLARSKGIIPATPESLFGEEVAAALMELVRILKDAATAAVNPSEFDHLFRSLGKIEGAANSLRGSLFEFVVAELVRKLWAAQITMNRIFREAGKDVAEVDVVAHVPNQRIHFIECKGHSPNRIVDDVEIGRWLTKRIPMVRRQALGHPDWKHLKMHFELWTTGNLSDAASKRIAEFAALRQGTFEVKVRVSDEITKMCFETNDSSFIKVVNQHFFEHPLAMAEKVARPIKLSSVSVPHIGANPIVPVPLKQIANSKVGS